jgi:GDP-L-fucose synthase
MNPNSKIYISGHRGLVGGALVREFERRGYNRIITVPRSEVDLTDPAQVAWFFSSYQPEYVFHCAAKVGGIIANRDNPVDFISENLRIQENIFANAHKYSVKKLLFLASACAYPKFATTPIREEALLTGPLEPSNKGYALAKILGITSGQAYRKQFNFDFISAIPTNLFGVGDNYDLENSHVIPGMIRRIHEAKMAGRSPILWGTGAPIREFLFSADLALMAIHLMERYSGESPVNVGYSNGIHLIELAGIVKEIVECPHAVIWDASMPDGTPNRQLDYTRLADTGWKKPAADFHHAIQLAYVDFLTRNARS